MAPSRIATPPPLAQPMKSAFADPSTTKYGDFQDDFFRDGYASWKGGMYLYFAAAHEKYVWDTRCEPGVIAPFEKLWGTKELLVSFDTVNITLPPSIVGDYDSNPWPHCDQAPERQGLACVQGIINLSEAGPKDGGLLAMKGSASLFDKFFKENPVIGSTQWRTAKHKDFHPFSEKDLEWYKAHGCELVKPEDQLLKKEMFNKYATTTHWPHCNLYTHGEATITVDGVKKPDPMERKEPITKPMLTEKLFRLAGIIPY
ncbi:hypothetical protein AOQ84DRAFT_397334 [Glonium stellatum]|uniref:Uncharacterized protein n=1 Tax=Glonium stellatum TaxID=574774 RepID=A0A8E2JU04_9PEZI|nr:hypothetical protein AOQ84DRAFT_397334 [Glonium stellatum]